MSGPVPGQSLTHAPKNNAWEKPAQFHTPEDAMNFLMNQILQPQNTKQMLGMMDAGMPIEAIARSVIFTGFSTGKWTPDTGMLIYKPFMLTLIALAHRAGINDVPITMPNMLEDSIKAKQKQYEMFSKFKGEDGTTSTPPQTVELGKQMRNGFMLPQGTS